MELTVDYNNNIPILTTKGFIPNFQELLQALKKNKHLVHKGTYYLKVVARLKEVDDLLPEALVGFLKNTNSAKIGLYLVPQTKELGYVWVPPHSYKLPMTMIPRSTMKQEHKESKIRDTNRVSKIGHKIRVSNPFGELVKPEEEEKTAFEANFPPLSGGKKTSSYNPTWGQNARKRI